MQYYRFDGMHRNSGWLGEGEEDRLLKTRIRSIAGRTQSFNAQLDGKAYFFVSLLTVDSATIGIILREGTQLTKKLNAFLGKIGLDLKETILKETTFEDIRSMLQSAWRKDTNLEDDDDVLERFDLDDLDNDFIRRHEFKEFIIPETSKESLYEEVSRIPMRETVLPELDRIFSGTIRTHIMGHPVHYFIETDDRIVRRTAINVLLGALYDRNRIHIRRAATICVAGTTRINKAGLECVFRNCSGGATIIDYSDQALYDEEDDRASPNRAVIESIAEPIRNYASSVLTVICLPRGCRNLRKLFNETLGSMSFVELREEPMKDDGAKAFLRLLAKDSHIRPDNKLYAELEQHKGYMVGDLRDVFHNWYNNKLKTSIYPQYREMASMRKVCQESKSRGSAWDELMNMIGLDEAKKTIRRALNYYKAQRLFADKGMKAGHPAMHMVFTGNPGTAKTTVARLFARIMQENELLERGHIVETGRSDLVGKYVGWTAPLIKEKFKEAKGGVLFIDEAYSLVDDRDGSYGDEAINTIVQEMENHREDTIVIFAGYPDKMEEFIRKNPGLRSRIAFHVPFADYSAQELTDIAALIAKDNDVTLTDEAKDKIREISEAALVEPDFGNGRFVRNLLEKARMAQADRLLENSFDTITRKDVSMIRAEDIEVPTKTVYSRRKIGF